MDTYWVPGVNNLSSYGRWAFAEFTDVYDLGANFNEVVESAIKSAAQPALEPNEQGMTD